MDNVGAIAQVLWGHVCALLVAQQRIQVASRTGCVGKVCL